MGGIRRHDVKDIKINKYINKQTKANLSSDAALHQ